MTLGELPGLGDDLLDALIRAPPAKALHKPREALIPGGIALLQDLPHHICLQKGQLPLVPDPEGRINIKGVVMVPDNMEAEAIDCGNLGLGNESRLEPEVLISRILPKALIHRCLDPLPHLRRRRVGKGHNQKAVNI